jgi:hypothetical protein
MESEELCVCKIDCELAASEPVATNAPGHHCEVKGRDERERTFAFAQALHFYHHPHHNAVGCGITTEHELFAVASS